MVEVHLKWFEATPAMCTRNVAPFAEHLRGSVLPNLDSEQFLRAVSTVIVDIRRTLIPDPGHRLNIEHTFDVCNDKLMQPDDDSLVWGE